MHSVLGKQKSPFPFRRKACRILTKEAIPLFPLFAPRHEGMLTEHLGVTEVTQLVHIFSIIRKNFLAPLKVI